MSQVQWPSYVHLDRGSCAIRLDLPQPTCSKSAEEPDGEIYYLPRFSLVLYNLPHITLVSIICHTLL